VNTKRGKLRVGTSGYQYNHWRDVFYPGNLPKKERFARGEPLLFVDVRNPKTWKASDMKLPGAVRVPADNVDGQLDGVSSGRMIVTYCI